MMLDLNDDFLKTQSADQWAVTQKQNWLIQDEKKTELDWASSDRKQTAPEQKTLKRS